MDLIVIYLPKIEFYARHASSDIYYTVKLQLSIGIVVFFIVFIDRLYFLIKLYLFNLGILKLNKIKYFSKPIHENYTSLGYEKYVYQLLFTMIISLYNMPIFYNENNITNSCLMESSYYGSYLWASFISVWNAILLSFIIIESLAQIYKFYKLKVIQN